MNRILTTIVCVLASLVAVKGAAAEQHAVRVTIPFDFVASGAQLPAGTYTIATRNGFTSITKNGTGEMTFVRAIPLIDTFSDGNKLVFSTDGDQRLLRKILCPGADMSLELPPSKPAIMARTQPAGNPGD